MSTEQEEAAPRIDLTIELLHIPGCPHVEPARQLLLECLADLNIPNAAVEKKEGAFASPSILVNGVDVMGNPAVASAACRLDVPTREGILAALRPLMSRPGAR
jgi:hypothetical protein